MNAGQLIELLQSYAPDTKVHCTAESGCVSVEVLGLDEERVPVPGIVLLEGY